MAYGDIPDLIFTVDSQGNVVYSNVTTTDNSNTGKTTDSTDKKWWEQLFGIIPGILTAILGNKAQGQTQVPAGGYYPSTPSASMNNSNMTIIIVAAAIILFLLMKKK